MTRPIVTHSPGTISGLKILVSAVRLYPWPPFLFWESTPGVQRASAQEEIFRQTEESKFNNHLVAFKLSSTPRDLRKIAGGVVNIRLPVPLMTSIVGFACNLILSGDQARAPTRSSFISGSPRCSGESGEQIMILIIDEDMS